jgi:ABC-type amino acid transport substrate-binding protein
MRISFCLTFHLFLHFTVYGQAADTLTLGYIVSPPFVQSENGELSGPTIWLWEQVAEKLDLHYELRPLSLQELVLQLGRGEIDLAVSPLTITSDRSVQFDFSPPYYIEQSSLLVPYKSPREEIRSLLRTIFSATFFRTLGILMLMILLFGFLTWFFEHKAQPKEFGKGWKGLWHGFWWSVVTMTTLGYGDRSPQTFGGRIASIVWILTSILILASFTASLTSRLMMDRTFETSRQIEDFRDSHLGTVSGSATEYWLMENAYPSRTSFTEVEEGLEVLARGGIDAFAYDFAILKAYLLQDTTDRFELNDVTFNPQFYAFGMSRSLPEKLKKDIDIALLQCTESNDWKAVMSEYGLR